ncbi:MAG: RNA polymerase sigma factor [Lachnospiraceae bacterium]|nr:RNA polymerase sigma factor [Lachnospiraceae bacterium]
MADDEAFFEELYLSTREALLKYLYSFGGLDGWGEDILHDTYFEAYKRREMLAKHPNPSGWLYQTAHNLYRNAKRRRDNCNLSLDIVPETECISEAEEYYKYIEWSVIMQSLLREKDRKLVIRYYIEGYSVREMAKEFNLTEENIRVKLTRIRKKMRSLRSRLESEINRI